MGVYDVRTWGAPDAPRTCYKVTASDMYAALNAIKALYPQRLTGYLAFAWSDHSPATATPHAA